MVFLLQSLILLYFAIQLNVTSGQCPKNCVCKRRGSCTSCQTGHKGYLCSGQCPLNCIDGCGKKHGNCHNGCVDGYFGRKCDSPCRGNCTECEQIGGRCTECKDLKTYGENCTASCPSTCSGQICNHIGHCFRCYYDRRGSQCTELCPPDCGISGCSNYEEVCNPTCFPDNVDLFFVVGKETTAKSPNSGKIIKLMNDTVDFVKQRVSRLRVGAAYPKCLAGGYAYSLGKQVETALSQFTANNEIIRWIVLLLSKSNVNFTAIESALSRYNNDANMIVTLVDLNEQNSTKAEIQRFVQKYTGRLSKTSLHESDDIVDSTKLAREFCKVQIMRTNFIDIEIHDIKNNVPRSFFTLKNLEIYNILTMDDIMADCSGKSIDILFIIDKSGSINPPVIDSLKSFIISLLSYFPNSNVRFGLISFANNATLEIQLMDKESDVEVKRHVNAVSNKTGGWTFASNALQMATETVSNRTYAILFTDGRFNDTMNTISSVNELKNNKATIIVIPLGTSYDYEVMAKISSQPAAGYIFPANSEQDLENSRQAIIMRMCEETPFLY